MVNGGSRDPALPVLTQKHFIGCPLCLSHWVLLGCFVCFCSTKLHDSLALCLWRELFAITQPGAELARTHICVWWNGNGWDLEVICSTFLVLFFMDSSAP